MTPTARLLAALPFALLLGGCPATTEPAAAPDSGPVANLPPADSSLRYVGRWATSAEYCGVADWVFTEGGFSTPGEVTCQFSSVTAVPGGYDVTAICYAEGPATPTDISIRFAESAGAMLLEGSPTAASSVVYCGPNLPNAPAPAK